MLLIATLALRPFIAGLSSLTLQLHLCSAGAASETASFRRAITHRIPPRSFGGVFDAIAARCESTIRIERTSWTGSRIWRSRPAEQKKRGGSPEGEELSSLAENKRNFSKRPGR